MLKFIKEFLESFTGIFLDNFFEEFLYKLPEKSQEESIENSPHLVKPESILGMPLTFFMFNPLIPNHIFRRGTL